MKERGILFNGDMVRAYRAGRKTMTRRPVRFGRHGKNEEHFYRDDLAAATNSVGVAIFSCDCDECRGDNTHQCLIRSPLGAPGDWLYTREAYRFQTPMDQMLEFDELMAATMPEPSRPLVYARFEADGATRGDVEVNAPWGKLRPSIHMPRWLARDRFPITGVRVERVQRISLYDVQAEGLEVAGYVAGFEIESEGAAGDAPEDFVDGARDDFRELWDSIYAKQGAGWEANPWVWVYEFPRYGEPAP